MSESTLQSLMTLILLLVLILWAVATFFLWYHWNRYEVSSARARLFISFYFLVSLVLIAVAGGMILLT